MKNVFAALSIALLLSAANTQAATFRNSYIQFWAPDDWACEPEGTEYVCKPPPLENGKQDAIIILTAKYAGESDSLSAYTDHLSSIGDDKPDDKVINGPHQITLRGVTWIDATHLNSEIKNYVTRYLATVNGGVAVLFTFSVHKGSEDKYAEDAEQIALSIRALRN